MNTSTVTVYIGPQGSGKTHTMRTYAEEKGMKFSPVRFSDLPEISRHNFIRFEDWPWVKERIQIPSGFQFDRSAMHLFIDDYLINDQNANARIDELSKAGISIFIASQEEPSIQLPESFRIIRLTGSPRHALHKKELWMRIGARVLANGHPGEIVSIWSHTDADKVYVDYIDVCLDGKEDVECFFPGQVHRDRIRREVCHA